MNCFRDSAWLRANQAADTRTIATAASDTNSLRRDREAIEPAQEYASTGPAQLIFPRTAGPVPADETARKPESRQHRQREGQRATHQCRGQTDGRAGADHPERDDRTSF